MRNHRLEKFNEKIKIMYLNGISVMIDIDDEIHEKEKEYLQLLVSILNLNNSILDKVIEFSKSLDQEKIIEILEVIKNENLEISFLVDLLIIKGIDGKHLENENKLFNVILNKFNLDENCINDINNFVEAIQKGKNDAIAILKNSNYLNYENFKYLLEYYKIN